MLILAKYISVKASAKDNAPLFAWDHKLVLAQRKMPHISRWFSSWYVDVQVKSLSSRRVCRRVHIRSCVRVGCILRVGVFCVLVCFACWCVLRIGVFCALVCFARWCVLRVAVFCALMCFAIEARTIHTRAVLSITNKIVYIARLIFVFSYHYVRGNE